MRQARRAALFVLFLLAIYGNRVLGQEESNPLSPTESYKASLAPFTATRNQPDDLTDADKVALGIGIARASHDCLALSRNTSSFSENAAEVFALGQLCIFGQQFEAARADMVNYLALPEPPQREQALVMLMRAFVGLNEPDSAEPQILSLLHDFPYDASIHLAIDNVIDSAEASNIASPFNDIALRLCQTQTANTLPILTSGKALQGKDSGVSAATLFSDAVRCAALAHSSGQQAPLNQLAAVAQQPRWAGTADLPVMQQALRRQQMVGERVPLSILHAHQLGASALIPRTVSVAHGTAMLVPFTLWSPSTPDVLANLARFAPQQSIYAITSWHVNTGQEDVASSQVLEGLRSWRRSLPQHVLILILPDGELNTLAADTFPAGILIRDGKVLMNSPISGKGEQRLLLKFLIKPPLPPPR
jgi:hypothetical protein